MYFVKDMGQFWLRLGISGISEFFCYFWADKKKEKRRERDTK